MVAQVQGNYADIYTWDNLYTAYRLAARGKRSRAAVAGFEYGSLLMLVVDQHLNSGAVTASPARI